MMKRHLLIAACMGAWALAASAGCVDKKSDSKKHQAGKSSANEPQRKLDTRVMAFAYGTRIATATTLSGSGAPASAVSSEVKQARLLAKVMNIATPVLPSRTKDKAADQATAVAFLRGKGAKQVTMQLGSLQGKQHAALFSLAVEMHLSATLYDPAAADNATNAQALVTLAGKAALPKDAVTAAAKALGESKPKPEVSAALIALRGAVTKHLRTLPPRVHAPTSTKKATNTRIRIAPPVQTQLDKPPSKKATK